MVLVNSAAIQLSGNRSYACLVKPDSTVTVRDITTGTSDGGDTEITSGLQPGDEVVMTGVDKLQEGTKVNAQIPGEQGGGRGAKAKCGQRATEQTPRRRRPGRRAEARRSESVADILFCGPSPRRC